MKDERTNELMHILIKCITACEACADACLDEPDPGHLAACMRLDRNCADICTLTARYVARGSIHAPEALRMCIDICDACHAECSRHDHWHCRKCAQACAECRDACRAYAGVAL